MVVIASAIGVLLAEASQTFSGEYESASKSFTQAHCKSADCGKAQR